MKVAEHLPQRIVSLVWKSTGEVGWRAPVSKEFEIEELEKPVPIDRRAEVTFEWARPSATPRGFETRRVYTCRKAEELAPAGDSGQREVIRLSVIDRSSRRFVIPMPTEGAFYTAPRTTRAALDVGARGIQ